MPRALSQKEMVRVLQSLSREAEWKADLRRTYAPVAKLATGMSRDRMRSSGDRQLARAARGLRANPSSTAAKISIGGTAVPTSAGPATLARAAIYGTKGPTGWYARPQYAIAAASTPNNPRWIGADWRVSTRGQGPRGINDALADGQPKIVNEFRKSAQATIGRAFPRSALS